MLICDSLPAAFEYADAQTEPRIDVILGAQPVLEYMVNRVRRRLGTADPRHWAATFPHQADYGVVVAGEPVTVCGGCSTTCF
ncbi:MAG: hypothetical protein MRJ92_09920 [Nitrospira sp.]|nr:hypothetical protein [Nitrospira sp.]